MLTKKSRAMLSSVIISLVIMFLGGLVIGQALSVFLHVQFSVVLLAYLIVLAVLLSGVNEALRYR